ncbi:hypothetical protein FEP39_03607 [Burkholderia multivorans]|nr:hypothetical protein [Burkholderia multivorans]MDR9060119.1 hypothetical protein [Burkholderia multivorans]MDR9062424.1 hypothetical protein [Burkholderia multivorans]MDR9070377.1 hypothetical protein [Burkholderia multivorans]MDR9076553.1 hypothetical protein [Burkholderia multivorans]
MVFATSPALAGTPTAPTASAGTNSTQLATTAFVATSYAPLASPALTGTPTAPTAAATTGTGTQIATLGAIANNAAYPYFQVQMAANQTGVSVNTWTKAVLGTVNYDPSNAWSAANNRWTPQKAGKYRVTIQLAVQSTITTTQNYIGGAAIYKNGSLLYGTNQTVYSGAGTMFVYPLIIATVTMNGSTDYIEAWGYVGGASAGQFTAGGSTYFEAQYVGP